MLSLTPCLPPPQGPCLAIDTACSSALVAVHSARNDMKNGFTDTAVAGGINTVLNPEVIHTLSVASMLSSSRCKTLDVSADGYVRGEAAALYRLSSYDVAAPGCVGLLHSTYINQDGRSSSLTAPNGPSQRDVITSAWQAASRPLSQMGTIQMHGTGTALGEIPRPSLLTCRRDIISRRGLSVL